MKRSRQSSSETLPGSAFLAHALSAKLGNITNITLFEPNEKNMLCFVTFWCQGKEAKLTAKLGNIANISLSEQKSGLSTCFVTFW